jgi:hypothetical protein
MRIHRAAGQAVVFFAVAVAAFSSSGCTRDTVNVHSAANPGARFYEYRTFSFGPAEGPPVGYQASPASREVQRRVVPLVAAVLVERGYSPASGKGDIFIMCGSGRRNAVVHDANDVSNTWLPDDEDADFVEGSLVIDAFDGATGVRVWHGASQAQIDPDHVDEGLLRRSVGKLLAAFPTETPPVQ